MSSLSEFKSFTNQLPLLEHLMPVLFIGHGSPMNGIENNEFSNKWTDLAKNIHPPTAVLVVSAHWFTKGTRITAMDFPPTIHDFGGFPQALFDVQYPASGNKELISTGNHQGLIEYEKLGKAALMAIPTPEHYLPLVYSLGLSNKNDAIHYFNDKAVAGSLTMTSVQFG